MFTLPYLDYRRHFLVLKKRFLQTCNSKSERRFGVDITYKTMQITALKAILGQRINITGCEDHENT